MQGFPKLKQVHDNSGSLRSWLTSEGDIKHWNTGIRSDLDGSQVIIRFLDRIKAVEGVPCSFFVSPKSA